MNLYEEGNETLEQEEIGTSTLEEIEEELDFEEDPEEDIEEGDLFDDEEEGC